MTTLGTRVSPADLAGIDVPDGYAVVWGETWEGKPTMRAIRPGYETVLRGEFGMRFDVNGPVVSMCRECEALLLSETAGHHTMTLQRHYAEHGISTALLP